MTTAAAAKLGALLLLVGASLVAVAVLRVPDVDQLRSRVDAAGAWGPSLFFLAYVALALLPLPRPLLTVAGGALFGFWPGAGLALGAALLSATVSFGLARLLGRDAVDRLTRGRAARVDDLLARRGLVAVVAARLVPVAPFLAVNYACGLSRIRRRDFVIGSALGMAPGSLTYAAAGAYGVSSPSGLLVLAVGAVCLLGLGVGTTWWVRPRGGVPARSGPSA